MDKKPWYSSLTLWSVQFVAVLTVLPESVTWMDTHFGLSLATNPLVVKILALAALAVTAYGRLTATTVLTANKEGSVEQSK